MGYTNSYLLEEREEREEERRGEKREERERREEGEEGEKKKRRKKKSPEKQILYESLYEFPCRGSNPGLAD